MAQIGSDWPHMGKSGFSTLWLGELKTVLKKSQIFPVWGQSERIKGQLRQPCYRVSPRVVVVGLSGSFRRW